jgi:hypothetical protein
MEVNDGLAVVVPRIGQVDQLGTDQRFKLQRVSNLPDIPLGILKDLAQSEHGVEAGWKDNVSGKFLGDIFEHLKALGAQCLT